MTDELFNVYQFFPGGSYEHVKSGLELEPALLLCKSLMESVGGQLGTTQRIIITDGGDNTCFEWQHGKGITFPTAEHVAKAAVCEHDWNRFGMCRKCQIAMKDA